MLRAVHETLGRETHRARVTDAGRRLRGPPAESHCSALSQREATRLVIDAITAAVDVAAIAERLRVREVGSPAK